MPRTEVAFASLDDAWGYFSALAPQYAMHWTGGVMVVRPIAQMGDSILDAPVGAFTSERGSFTLAMNQMSVPFAPRSFRPTIDNSTLTLITKELLGVERRGTSQLIYRWTPSETRGSSHVSFAGGTLEEALSGLAEGQEPSAGWLVLYCGGAPPTANTAIVVTVVDDPTGTVRRYMSVMNERGTADPC